MTVNNELLIQALQLQEQGEVDKAAEMFRKLLCDEPNNAAGLFSLALITLKNLRDPAESIRLLERGITVAPAYGPMRALYGDALQAAGAFDAALQAYEEALRIDPDFVVALINSGVLLQQLSRHHEALEKFNRVLTIAPDNALSLSNCGILLTEFKQSEQAIAMFRKLLEVDPDYPYALGLLCFEKLHICDWSEFDALSGRISTGVRAGKKACKTLALMAISDIPGDLLMAARTFTGHMFPPASQLLWNGEKYRHHRIRIAYVSADLREHPVGHLMAGVLESHDKSRFETIAISLGIDDKSRIRDRMLKAFDHFVDAQKMGSRQIAQLMRDMEVDIAINLSGYTSGSRTEIFAFHPAPVQVNFLGYPGTMGADYIEYILADRHVIPEEHREFYSEKIACLPDSYLPTDGNLKISARTPTRKECALPETGFVFCSFNHDYKISPAIFAIWMRLLAKVEGSLLWLMKLNEPAQRNLWAEAEKHGIDPKRLIFATRVPLVEDHLARYRLADVFLDTYPYNAHTTAADALFAGLPVITYMGNIFQGRVAGSLLHTLGLPELVTDSLEDYEALALALATNPDKLAAIRKKVSEQRELSPLFGTERFCRNLESAYITMWERWQQGLEPDHFQVTQPHVPQPESNGKAAASSLLAPTEPRPVQHFWPIRIKNDVQVCVHPNVHQMSSYVLLEQEDWFEDEMDFVRAFVTPEMNVLDIGANHGVYALSLARKIESGHIWAFEPTISPGTMLANSIRLNGFDDKITWVHAGLSDHSGYAEISTSANSELNSLHAVSGKRETIRLEALETYLTEHNIDAEIGFVKLDAEGEEVNVLRGGNGFFNSQSPLVMFERVHGSTVNHGLIDAFQQLGYGIYRLLPDINVLVEYTPAFQGEALNLFACKPGLARMLSGRGMLAGDADIALVGSEEDFGDAWVPHLQQLPYAKICEQLWISNAEAVPEAYLRALGACFLAHDASLPAARRVALLQDAGRIVDGLIQQDPQAHYAVWLLKIHLLNVQNYRALSVHLCRQLIATFTSDTTPAWPFILPSKPFFDRIPQGSTGSWLHGVLREFIEYRQGFSSYFNANPLPDLKILLDAPGHGLAIERRFALAARKSGHALQLPPGFPLLDPQQSANSAVWHQILGIGSSCIWLEGLSPVHIVDIGASSHGRMTEPYAPLMQMGLARVTGFEPNQPECQRLNEMYQDSGRYRYFPEFVGSGGPATFYETNWYMTGSLYKPDATIMNSFEQLGEVTALQAEHPVQTVRLEHLDAIADIDMIKIDVQGAELDVFRGAAGKLDDVLVIWTEVEFVPLYERQPLFGEVDGYLRERGFIFHAFEGIATRAFKPYSDLTPDRRGCRQAIWSDAVFVRDPAQWERLTTPKLKKMAAILDAVIKSYDLCHLALQLIDSREGSRLAQDYVKLRQSL